MISPTTLYRPLSIITLKLLLYRADLSTRIQALEEIAKLEDRLKVLENRKRPRSYDPE